ncbi:hypothetical protein L3N51_02349 [Metallosphaera sp. J1]|uniref:AAA family ATPase n=1 Tax=Metallosphaera javensis (ex Hofmann et al. 2022) TaxID=99938 RepID=UPI001EDCF7D0|nr:ATP-binding protein [Metallosphaera javensis (ex Hofmann et al. 2022)]MCG3110052.1 hypothetical protein [Metallosphaera javensis (ex Hofmann et al. 2022)]
MLVIYFEPTAKETRDDLFDREKELRELHALVGRPIILLTGVRRIGKTSVLKVFLNEVDLPHALVDTRMSLSSYKNLYVLFSEVLSQINRRSPLRSLLEHISGVSFFGVNVSLSWDVRSRPSLAQIMDRVNESGKVVIALDEAQNLRGKVGNEMLSLLAHCYDYCRNITFILTGSEIGLLRDFLRLEDPSSPLYGRHVEEIRLERFDSNASREFLERGFSQVNLSPSQDVLDYAVESLDGVVGWLTEFGYRCVRTKEVRKEFVDEVIDVAGKTVLHELGHLSRNYVLVLEAIALGHDRWSEIKRYLEEKEKRIVYDAEIKRFLERLEKMSYVTRRERGRYELTDPVVRRALGG